MTGSDRTIHGRTRGGSEIVRYDRAGKWYLEGDDQIITVPGGRVRIPLDEAVFHAIQDGAEAFTGLPGGKQFDARIAAEG
jgi:hypothetical protein